jgi:hypothetical protein
LPNVYGFQSVGSGENRCEAFLDRGDRVHAVEIIGPFPRALGVFQLEYCSVPPRAGPVSAFAVDEGKDGVIAQVAIAAARQVGPHELRKRRILGEFRGRLCSWECRHP